jgi:hypothetical protein
LKVAMGADLQHIVQWIPFKKLSKELKNMNFLNRIF